MIEAERMARAMTWVIKYRIIGCPMMKPKTLYVAAKTEEKAIDQFKRHYCNNHFQYEYIECLGNRL